MKARFMLPLLTLVAAAAVLLPGAVFAQDGTGAQAFKDCPGVSASPGDTITCNFAVANTGDTPATITELTETSPDPGGAPVDISCVNGGITYNEGDVLPNAAPCVGSFVQTVPNDPALCGTTISDRVTIALAYLPGPLTAGAFATHTTAIVCPANISAVKTASALSKVGDDVDYTITITNDGDGIVNRTSVNDSLLGDISSSFAASLAPGASTSANFTRTVLAGDSDPLVNTVTAIYGTAGDQDTATANASTNLFQPNVALDKTGNVSTAQVGDTVNYTITASNTGSPDSPNCVGAVVDPLLGVNQAVSIAPGANVVINASRAVAAGDPDPLVNTATLTCSPAGFPNVLTASDTHSVDLIAPNLALTKACAPSPANVGDTITYTFVISNPGDTAMDRVSVSDTLLGDLAAAFPASLAPGASVTVTQTRAIQAGDPSPLPNTVTAVYQASGTSVTITRNASCSVVINPPPGGEGCTPGFWKQDQHFDSWVGFAPSDSFDAVFGVDVTLRIDAKTLEANPTLLQALGANGGGINALARHAVAALLNASSPDVDSGFTVAQVIALVQAAVASGDFETAHQLLAADNEQGCPLS